MYRYRKQILSLDSALMLTQGSPLSAAAFLVQIHPSRGSYTSMAIAEDDSPPLIGQVNYQSGERSARVAFITPENASILTALPLLLEDLARQSGEWGAYHLLAEMDETSPAFEAFRRVGFSVFAWQQVWKLPGELKGNSPAEDWAPADLEQENNIRSLFQSLVPPLVLAAEPASVHTFQGLACVQNGEAVAYADLDFGPRGIYIKPLFHPDAVDVDCLIESLVSALPNTSRRPVYLVVRSYQSWLENGLRQLGAEYAPRQAVLVKHLIVRQPNLARERGIQALEPRRVEPSAPMARMEKSTRPPGVVALISERKG